MSSQRFVVPKMAGNLFGGANNTCATLHVQRLFIGMIQSTLWPPPFVVDASAHAALEFHIGRRIAWSLGSGQPHMGGSLRLHERRLCRARLRHDTLRAAPTSAYSEFPAAAVCAADAAIWIPGTHPAAGSVGIWAHSADTRIAALLSALSLGNAILLCRCS